MDELKACMKEGRKECQCDLKLRKFRPRSLKSQVLKAGLTQEEKQEEEGQRTAEDIDRLEGAQCGQ